MELDHATRYAVEIPWDATRGPLTEEMAAVAVGKPVRLATALGAAERSLTMEQAADAVIRTAKAATPPFARERD